MPKLDLKLLGKRIHAARKECGLTQEELAHQIGLSTKTIRDIEKGRKNPSYKTLSRLIYRLGLSPDTAFLLKEPTSTEEIEDFLEDFQSCEPKAQAILLNTLRFLAEQLHNSQDESE